MGYLQSKLYVSFHGSLLSVSLFALFHCTRKHSWAITSAYTYAYVVLVKQLLEKSYMHLQWSDFDLKSVFKVEKIVMIIWYMVYDTD